MTFNKVMFSSATDHWSTPTDVYNALNAEFMFDFDPCPLGSDFNGLEIPWGKSTFVNPPYSEIKRWVNKAYNEWIMYSKKVTIVMLIPSRTDTRWWHEYVMKATEIRFIKRQTQIWGSRE